LARKRTLFITQRPKQVFVGSSQDRVEQCVFFFFFESAKIEFASLLGVLQKNLDSIPSQAREVCEKNSQKYSPAHFLSKLIHNIFCGK
jgi:hypothetical protein